MDENDFITFKTTETKCDELYAQAVVLQSRGCAGEALPLLMECVKLMRETHYLAKLPPALHQLAQAYHSLELYDKAVECAQAEKICYEAMILDSQGRSKGKRSPRKRSKSNSTISEDPSRSEAEQKQNHQQQLQKAEEYERLSQACAGQNKPQLALEYCGKAVRIKQALLGPGHQATVEGLENFTRLYAEAGKDEYAKALETASLTTSAAEVEDVTSGPDHAESATPSPSSSGDKLTATTHQMQTAVVEDQLGSGKRPISLRAGPVLPVCLILFAIFVHVCYFMFI